MKITLEQAETIIKETFGKNAEFPKVTIGSAVAYGKPYIIEYSAEKHIIYVDDVETVWEIDLVSGEISHCGKGQGCFWVTYWRYEKEEK